MGFIFRTIFWLSAAVVILPPGSRLGGDGVTEFRDVDIEHELRAAAYSVWTLASSASEACDDNPDLCQSLKSLWAQSVSAATDLAAQAPGAWEQASAGLEEHLQSRKETGEN